MIPKNAARIAHITTVDLSLRLLLLHQIQTIQAAGFEVTGISSGGPDVPFLEAQGMRHLAVPMSRRFTPWKDVVSLWRLVHLMRREKFTIVHTHNPKPGLLGQLAARIAGVPIVVNTLHGFYFHDHMPPFWRRFYIAMEKIAARCSDLILSQNKEDIATAAAEGIGRPELFEWLGNGIAVEQFDRRFVSPETIAAAAAELGVDLNRPVVGFVGRLVAEKGILELLAAAQTVIQSHPETQFLIVGPYDAEKPDAITPAVAKSYGLADHFIFTGMRRDMPTMYALMDIFVLPSHREGFPRSPMEASASGVPSIATDIRGCREAVWPEENGNLVPLGDVSALSSAIIKLLADDEYRLTLGRQAYQIAQTYFDEKIVFERVIQTYHQLLNQHGLAPDPQEKQVHSS